MIDRVAQQMKAAQRKCAALSWATAAAHRTGEKQNSGAESIGMASCFAWSGATSWLMVMTESGDSRPAARLACRCISAASAAFGKVALK